MKEDINKIKKKFADIIDYPNDVVLDLPKITIAGNMELVVDNHKGIIEYKEDLIRLNSSIGVIKISGANLMIKDIETETMYITGKIMHIEFPI